MKPNLEEGSSPQAKLLEQIVRHGFNRELFIEQGVVVSELPDLKIEVADDIILEKDELIVAEHLTRHTRRVRINDSTTAVNLEYMDQLALGDRVIILSDDDTDEYFVIDRAVMYE